MSSKLTGAVKEAESNVYSGINALNGTIVLLWTLLCLFVISRSKSPLFALVSGGVFYVSLVLLCMILFKDIRKYTGFPSKNKKMPVFIGHKWDTLFVYPAFLMVLIGIISSLLAAAGLFQSSPQQLDTAGSSSALVIAKVVLLPLVAFAEELLNLLTASFCYNNLKPLRRFRFIGSILSAALFFGIMHSFGWGLNASISIGISYIPVFLTTLYTGNIWISFLAHLYNDLISFAKSYNNGFHFIVIVSVSIIPVLWAVRTMFRKTP